MTDPTLMSIVEKNIHRRGLKTWQRRPIRGPRDDMAIKYAEVNQLAFSNASKSAAIDDWVVVRIDMLVAVLVSGRCVHTAGIFDRDGTVCIGLDIQEDIPCRKMSIPTDPTMKDPRNVEMRASSSLLLVSERLGVGERPRRGARSADPLATVMVYEIIGVAAKERLDHNHMQDEETNMVLKVV